MEQVGAILDRVLNPPEAEPAVPCRVCGAVVRVMNPELQFTATCPGCGNKITLTKGYRRRWLRTPPREIKCWACMDAGFVYLPRQVDEAIFKCVFRCICAAGAARPETGISRAFDLDLTPAIRANQQRYGAIYATVPVQQELVDDVPF
ncbi:MAG: hypothetical protein AB1510_02220 [Bacillota bacterium]